MKYLTMILLIANTLLVKDADLRKNPPSVEQKSALRILVNKCNVCHQTKNPSKVFTIENMNAFSKRINRQVFIWKRMPKGKDIVLTEQEKHTLIDWINHLN